MANNDKCDMELEAALHYHNEGQFQRARLLYQAILDRDSANAEALHLMGVLAHQTGDHYQARLLIEKAIRINSANPFYHGNLGVVYHALADPNQSILCYRKALELKPDYVEAYSNLANIYRRQGRLGQAAVLYQRTLCLRPQDARVLNSLGHVYRELGEVGNEIACYRKALQVDPDYAQTYLNLGNTLQYQGELDRAIVCYRKALERKADFPEACNNMGSVFIMQGRLSDAARCFKKALSLNPCYAEAYNNLGSIDQNQGRIRESVFCFKKALEIKPDYTKAHSNLLYALHYDPAIDSRILFEAAGQWWQQHGFKPAETWLPAASTGKSGPIRIGFVSPDFREHSVSYFFLPFIENRDQKTFEIFCYSAVKREDAITHRIRELSDHWRSVAWLSDASVVERIRSDGIDILVDLSGHTAGNRLPVFGCKPAPVQVTWLGYPGTTGLAAIDYRLTDDIADPPGEADKYHSERLIRLPLGFLCYEAPDDAPAVGGLPALRNGFITFGSFNNLPKINGEVIELWSDLLRQVPGSRLLLKSRQFADAHVRQRFLEMFGGCGIAAGRITLLPRVASTAGHLGLYHQVDIALDPFPYNGTTTTCESLWMGVPVITLRGVRHAGRVGVSLLTRLGLTQLVAEDRDAYIDIGIKLAQDIAALANLRSALRPRLQGSELCDGRSFARKLENAFRGLWSEFISVHNTDEIAKDKTTI